MKTKAESVENWQGKHIIKLRDYKIPTPLNEPAAIKLREELAT